MAGGKVNAGLDGVDLLPFLTGKFDGRPHQELYWRQGHKTAVRSGDWKLVNMERRSRRWELYDLSEDLGEASDLSQTHPDKVEELETLWKKFDGQMRDPLFK